MKTFEGTFTIKWTKNSTPDTRPITIDCEDKEELQKEQQRIKDMFSKGDDKYCHYYQNWHDNFIPPYPINFNMNERK